MCRAVGRSTALLLALLALTSHLVLGEHVRTTHLSDAARDAHYALRGGGGGGGGRAGHNSVEQHEQQPPPQQEQEWHSSWVPGEGPRSAAEWASIRARARHQQGADSGGVGDDPDAAAPFLEPLFGEFAATNAALRRVLRAAASLLRDSGARHMYSATHGTLLGAVRGADVLPFDTDADIGLLVPGGFEALAAAVGGRVRGPAGGEVGRSAKHNVKVVRHDAQWKITLAGGMNDAGIDVWPVYRSFKRQEGRDAVGFLRQGSVTFAELPTYRSVALARPAPLHGGAFEVQAVPDAAAQLKRAYGDDCLTTVKVWNAELNNEHLDPRHSADRYTFPLPLFNKVYATWLQARRERGEGAERS